MILEVEPGSPADLASLMSGDILIGTEEKAFTAIEDLAGALQGSNPRVLRVEFLRGDYTKIRRVAVQLGTSLPARSPVAA